MARSGRVAQRNGPFFHVLFVAWMLALQAMACAQTPDPQRMSQIWAPLNDRFSRQTELG